MAVRSRINVGVLVAMAGERAKVLNFKHVLCERRKMHIKLRFVLRVPT